MKGTSSSDTCGTGGAQFLARRTRWAGQTRSELRDEPAALLERVYIRSRPPRWLYAYSDALYVEPARRTAAHGGGIDPHSLGCRRGFLSVAKGQVSKKKGGSWVFKTSPQPQRARPRATVARACREWRCLRRRQGRWSGCCSRRASRRKLKNLQPFPPWRDI